MELVLAYRRAGFVIVKQHTIISHHIYKQDQKTFI